MGRGFRQRPLSTAEMTCAMTVASATPATLIWNTMTNIRFSATFTSPDTVRKYRGRLVSPTARRMALPKVYRRFAGMPAK